MKSIAVLVLSTVLVAFPAAAGPGSPFSASAGSRCGAADDKCALQGCGGGVNSCLANWQCWSTWV
jgi:hypothetical protein